MHPSCGITVQKIITEFYDYFIIPSSHGVLLFFNQFG